MGVILCIAGSRTLVPSRKEIDDAVAKTGMWGSIDCVRSGMARGADLAGFRWARAHDLSVFEYKVTPEDWDRLGKSAGHQRNARMAKGLDYLVAFVDTRSGRARGTINMIENVQRQILPAEWSHRIIAITDVEPCEVCGGEAIGCRLNQISPCCHRETNHAGTCPCEQGPECDP